MKKYAIALILFSLAARAGAGDLGGSGLTFGGGGASLTNSNTFQGAATFQSTVDILGNTTVGSQDGSKSLIVGGGASDTNPTIKIDKDAAGAGQVVFLDQGAQRAQITLDSSEALIIGTDSNQNVQIRVNSATKAIFDTSGQLNLGTTITNGQAALNISASNAMFSVVGSTATGTNALANIATTTPCGSNSVVGVSIKLCASNGTGCGNYYLLGCPQ